jgi:hypothetical protein
MVIVSDASVGGDINFLESYVNAIMSKDNALLSR